MDQLGQSCSLLFLALTQVVPGSELQVFVKKLLDTLCPFLLNTLLS